MKFFFALFTIGLSLAAPSVLAAPALGIASIDVEIKTNGPFEKHRQILTDETRKVIPLRVGEPFEMSRLEQALSYLKKWGRFSAVDAEKTVHKDGVHLRFLLKEGFLISGIDIYGGYPYLSVRLRRIITIHAGELFDPERAAEQAKKLEAFYGRRGYVETKVSFTPSFNQKKGTVDLVYRVQKSLATRLGKITVTGATVFPYRYFVSQLNPLLAYTPSRFRKRLDKIRSDYKKKGYLRARIRLKDLGREESGRTVNPVLEVSEGRHVSVVFEGNHRVSRKTFKEIVPMYTEGGYDDYDIEASVQSMKGHYRKLGFQETVITSHRSDLGKGLLVKFLIREGPQTRIKKISIEGHNEVSAGKIKKDLVTRENSLVERGYYQPWTIEHDFQELPKILQGHGALEGKALGYETTLNRRRDKAHISFTIEEGGVTRVKEVRFMGNRQIKTPRLMRRLKLRQDDPLQPALVERDAQEIQIFYANSGFPYAQVTPEISREGNAATLLYRVEEGSEALIGQVLVVGNERTEGKSVLKGIFMKTGDPFSYRKILDSESALRKTGAFRGVHIETIGLTEREPVVHLLVRLEEYRRILLDFGAAYDTDHQFTGNLTLNYLNLLGTMRRSTLKLTGGRDRQLGELILRDPNFLSLHWDGSLSGKMERERRPGFETIEGGGAVSLLKDFTARTSFLGRYEIIRTFFTDVTDATGLSEEDHTTSRFSFSLSYDRRDSFADPRRGFFGLVGFDVSNKLIASTFNFIQPKGYLAHYIPLGNRVTWLNFFHIEGIEVFGNDNLTRDERLFLGGDYSLRGFDEDGIGPVGSDGRPAGGQLLLSYTTELQTLLFDNFKLALFMDSGSLTSRFTTMGSEPGINTDTLRHSGGFGLRYMTPVGPIRLDYGIKLDRLAGESFGRLHFAFGYVF